MAFRLIDAVRDSGVRELTNASNDAGIDGEALGRLLRTRQVRTMMRRCSSARTMPGRSGRSNSPPGVSAEEARAKTSAAYEVIA